MSILFESGRRAVSLGTMSLKVRRWHRAVGGTRRSGSCVGAGSSSDRCAGPHSAGMKELWSPVKKRMFGHPRRSVGRPIKCAGDIWRRGCTSNSWGCANSTHARTGPTWRDATGRVLSRQTGRVSDLLRRTTRLRSFAVATVVGRLHVYAKTVSLALQHKLGSQKVWGPAEVAARWNVEAAAYPPRKVCATGQSPA
jgi:hypothetical protein